MSRLLLTSLVLLGLCACNAPAPLIIDSSCVAFAPIYASKQDTTETKRQILSHNQSWQSRCGGQNGH